MDLVSGIYWLILHQDSKYISIFNILLTMLCRVDKSDDDDEEDSNRVVHQQPQPQTVGDNDFSNSNPRNVIDTRCPVPKSMSMYTLHLEGAILNLFTLVDDDDDVPIRRPLPPLESGSKYSKMMSGVDDIMELDPTPSEEVEELLRGTQVLECSYPNVLIVFW